MGQFALLTEKNTMLTNLFNPNYMNNNWIMNIQIAGIQKEKVFLVLVTMNSIFVLGKFLSNV